MVPAHRTIRTQLASAAVAGTLTFSLASSAEAAVPHTVQPGETLWSIAAASNFTTRTVAAFNGLSEDALVVPGQTVQIPSVDEGAAALESVGITPATSAPTSSSPASTASSGAGGGGHTVVSGESLSSIASANGISISSLAAANGRSADAYAYIGEGLQIPSGSSASTSTGSTAGLGHVPSPYGELHLDPGAADNWNAMRQQSLGTYGQDIYPAGPVSAHRTYDQQEQLYQDYLNGVGPLAAPPGTSAHEIGRSVDLQTPEMRSVIDSIGGAFGWGKTEAWEEWWHVNYFGP